MQSPLAYEREGYDVRHIRELFGDVRLTSLMPDDIRRAYAKARKTGRFTESELRRIHSKLKQIMQVALENELIHRNPCVSIKLPKRDGETRQALTLPEAQRLLLCLESENPSSNIVSFAPCSYCAVALEKARLLASHGMISTQKPKRFGSLSSTRTTKPFERRNQK